MARAPVLCVLGAVLGVFPPLVAAAAIPDAVLSAVPDVITLTVGPTYGANPMGTFTTTIVDAAGIPCVGIDVEIIFPTGADALVAWAPGQDFTATTDAAGVATFVLEGGGCVEPVAYGGVVAEIYADGILMDDAYIVSPDAVNSLGLLPTTSGDNNCETGGLIKVGLSDLVFLTDAIKGGLVFPCGQFATPYTGGVALADVVTMTPYMRDGRVGSCAP